MKIYCNYCGKRSHAKNMRKRFCNTTCQQTFYKLAKVKHDRMRWRTGKLK